MNAKTQIGWYVLDTDQEFTNASYECAAWYQRVRVSAGRYPVYAEVSGDGEIKDHPGPSVALPGTVTASNFSSYWCGNPIGKGKRDENIGQSATHHLSTYAHALALTILRGESTPFVLEGFEARKVPFVYNGEQKETAGIFRVNS